MLQLLHKLVDHLDNEEAAGQKSVRDFKLNRRNWPAFYGAELEGDREQLWSNVEWLAQQGWFEIKLDMPKSPQAPYERKPRWVALDALKLREATKRPQRVVSAKEQWRIAVQQHLHASDEVKKAVSSYLIEIAGEPAEAVVLRLNGLFELASEPLLLREVSSKLFSDHSKLLDSLSRQKMIAVILGLDECPFPPMPVQLQIFLPPQGYQGVLFIENQTTFELAIKSNDARFDGLALVFSAGFKGSAKRLRTRSRSSLYFSWEGDVSPSATTEFANWLYQESTFPSWFWGDLDYSGMQILQAMRNSFPGMSAWPAGYGPMHHALINGGGHDPEMADKILQKRIEHTGCRYADTVLLPALHDLKRFVDQEMM
ncbi:Wadjet anti-phage system protein JetD domain-containing protein [Collimonas sp.]|jgi:hypothetical protein|uniref:Wadjet anti-phage system protein JetD domain-containing protein n=1 Tax=Collimonas sp. TaxID=1963772 RepID=UPI0037BFA538